MATHESAIPSITLWLLQAPVPSVRRQHEHSEGLRRLSCVRAEFLELWDNAVPRDTPPLQVEALKEESRALSRRLTTGAISQQKQSETEGAVTREEPSQSPAMLPVTTTERVAAATATSSDRAAVSPTRTGETATELQAMTTTPATAPAAAAAAAAAAAPTRRVRVTVEERTFRPATLRVPVGTLVEWVCGRSVKMAHVLALGLDNLESIPIAPGKPPFTWLFTDPGVFAYHSQVCLLRAPRVCSCVRVYACNPSREMMIHAQDSSAVLLR